MNSESWLREIWSLFKKNKKKKKTIFFIFLKFLKKGSEPKIFNNPAQDEWEIMFFFFKKSQN